MYHPWSKTANSVITYYTIIGLVSYKALRATKLEENYIRKGDVIDNVHALSEGYCAGRLKSTYGKKEIESWKLKGQSPITVIPCCTDENLFRKENINKVTDS